MASVSVPPAEILLSKRVQEMVLTGEQPLGPYLCRDEHEGINEGEKDDHPIPTVDIGCFEPGKWSTEESERELEKLKSALSTWGCFQAIGHGIPSAFLDRLRRVGREFFQQPMHEKNKYAKTVTEFEGYGADPVPEQGQSLDWSDRIFIVLVPEDQRNYRFWPQNPASFKETLEEYSEEMKRVTDTISKSMARSLNLDESCFLKQFGDRAQYQARFNYYSPCTRPDLVLGLKAHADGSGYTVIVQDEPGLQILNDGEWCTVAQNPDNALIVLMGDQMEIMSNGVFKSPVHRVVSDSEKDRMSVAVFYSPEVGREIGPEEGLISEEGRRVFGRVKDYADVHWGYYQKGMRALHTVSL
ncbi:2-oxoglutarate (2OG) and Fe(II)-dependent oxygenase superfamily protein [Striga hermonthica]|uniref:2-oxoglutarate (2OG) and Fe(II)-dependent oxygenase superfamily protein n=1 Tax=Striga hermonthica TaxID=68872 RepID=A0A9N7MX13_STRHE|nr:2-oxoglutarate (2OG) and Fe(II)-dependent oxygenase superfamily protein [Striga hermonthica]